MSKAVGKVLQVAAIIVAVAAAIPTGGGSFLLASGLATAIGAGIAVASFANAALMKPGGDNQARQAAVTTLQIGEVARQAVFGLGAVAGSLVDAFNYGGKYGTDWEVMVVAVADHLCDALVGFYVNDVYVAFTGDGAVTGYKGQLQVFWRPGSADQVPPAVLTSYGGWSGNDRLRGVAYVVFAYKADASDAKAPVWTGGRPSFLSVVRGLKLYDPRRDSSVPGGSGPHRWADPSTREWSDNAELCRYNYDRGIYACDRIDQPSQLLIGRGLSAIEAPPERVFAAANLCDEDVPLKAGGSEKRYRCGGVIAASDKFGDVAEDFAAAMGGIVIQPEGSVAVEPGHGKSPVAYITDDDLVAGTKVTFSEMRTEADDEWCNTVIPRYVEPTQKWADHGAPIRRNSADVIADGGPREAPLSLKLVTSGTQAQRIGEIRRRMGRLQRSAAITLGPRFAELESGDWIVWTSARRTKGLPVQFRIESDALSREWRNSLGLREINSSVFAWSAADEIANGATAEAQVPPDGFGVPDAGAWALAGTVIAGADGTQLPAIVFTGAVEDAYVSEVRFEYRVFNAANGPADGWIGTELAASQVTERRIVLGAGVQYQGAVSYRFPNGQPGERLILGPVTAGSLQFARGAYLILRQSVDYPVASTATTITIAAFSGVLDDGRTIDFPARTITGLTASTIYMVLWDLAVGQFIAVNAPALTQVASSAYVIVREYTTQNADGTYPSTPTPPGGDGGGGYGGACPVPDALVLLADDEHTGPGRITTMGELQAGMWVWSPHEHTGEWRAWQVELVWRFASDVFEVAGRPRTSPSHLWAVDPTDPRAGWERMDTVGTAAGEGDVIGVTITEAHTYVLIGDDGSWLLSHNKRATQDDR